MGIAADFANYSGMESFHRAKDFINFAAENADIQSLSTTGKYRHAPSSTIKTWFIHSKQTL